MKQKLWVLVESTQVGLAQPRLFLAQNEADVASCKLEATGALHDTFNRLGFTDNDVRIRKSVTSTVAEIGNAVVGLFEYEING